MQRGTNGRLYCTPSTQFAASLINNDQAMPSGNTGGLNNRCSIVRRLIQRGHLFTVQKPDHPCSVTRVNKPRARTSWCDRHYCLTKQASKQAARTKSVNAFRAERNPQRLVFRSVANEPKTHCIAAVSLWFSHSLLLFPFFLCFCPPPSLIIPS